MLRQALSVLPLFRLRFSLRSNNTAEPSKFFVWCAEMQLLQGPLIRTKYLGPTNYRGSRITATHKRDGEQTQRVTLSWDHSMDGLENAKAAALALCAKWPYEQTMSLVACGFDHDHYYFIASTEPISNPA